MSLPNPNLPVTEERLQEFYDRIKPFMGGGSEGGGGHTIEDAEGTDLTQRDTMQFGEGFSAQDDSTNEKTVIAIDPMPAEDMGDVIDELPTGGNIAVTGYVPLATIIQYYGETPPDFFLACDGSTYNKSDYPELAKHLLSLTNNTPYIVDGDNTKFKVPDLRGEFIRGTGSNSHTNQGSGADVGVHQDATIHPYEYVLTTGEGAFRGYVNASGVVVSAKQDTLFAGEGYKQSTETRNAPSSSFSGNSAFTSRPTNTSVLFCIAYKDIYSNPMNDYSTDEKVVGTWIDGKTIYQRSFEITNAGIVVNQTGTGISIFDATSLNIRNVVEPISGYCDWGDNSFQTLPTSFMTQEQWVVCDLYYNPLTKIISFRGQRKTGSTNVNNIWFTIRYTKTTDI